MHKLNFLHIKHINIKQIKKAFFLFLFILISLPKEKAFSSLYCFSLLISSNQTIRTGSLREDFPIRKDRFFERWGNSLTQPTSSNYKIKDFSNDEIIDIIMELYSFNDREVEEIIDIIRKTMGIIEDKSIPLLSIPIEQIKNIVESPLFLDFLTKNIENSHLLLSLRYNPMSLKWEQRKDFIPPSLLPCSGSIKVDTGLRFF